jgi:hypothetical protein
MPVDYLERWNREPRSRCSIEVQNPGSSGGLTTVTTDASLKGNGTSGSPLGEVPITFFGAYFNSTATGLGATANTISLAGFSLPVPFTLSNITVFINTVDAAHNSDIGIYSAAGALLAHAGAQAFATANTVTFAMIGAPIAIPKGSAIIAFTSAASTLKISNSAQTASWCYSASTGTSTGGALPNTITAPTIAVGFNSINFAFS